MGVELNHGAFVDLESVSTNTNIVGLQMDQDNRKAELRIELMNTQRQLNVMRVEKRCVNLPKETESGRKWLLLVDTILENSRHIVYLKSLLNV